MTEHRLDRPLRIVTILAVVLLGAIGTMEIGRAHV